jgi:hypothetical protein
MCSSRISAQAIISGTSAGLDTSQIRPAKHRGESVQDIGGHSCKARLPCRRTSERQQARHSTSVASAIRGLRPTKRLPAGIIVAASSGGAGKSTGGRDELKYRLHSSVFGGVRQIAQRTTEQLLFPFSSHETETFPPLPAAAIVPPGSASARSDHRRVPPFPAVQRHEPAMNQSL